MLGLTIYPFGLHGYHKGGDGGAAKIREQEEQRNAKILKTTQEINSMFDGTPASKRGTGQKTTNFVPGQTYYDDAGNPTVYQAPVASTGVDAYGDQFMSGLRASQQGPATPLYTGVEDIAAKPGFDENYFANIADAYLKYQTPLVEEQAAVARRNLPSRFGSTASSAFQRESSNFERDYQRELVNLKDKSLDFANTQRGEVERNRSDLIGMANSGTDSSALASQTNARISALSKPPAYSPIADLFSKFSAQGAQLAQANMYANHDALYYGSPSNAVRNVK
jgi:hypothetical protein